MTQPTERPVGEQARAAVSDALAALPRDAEGFRLRGAEMTRVETFTDAAFAFALTLLVISNDPVSDTAQLRDMLRLVPVFLLSGSMLMTFWWGHHGWSRRYGLDDGRSAVLSIMLVFTVLVFVYPLRFVFGSFMFWLGLITGLDLGHPAFATARPADINHLFAVYGAGFVAMSVALLLLYAHAWRQRAVLQLDVVEQVHTRNALAMWSIYAGVGAFSLVLALTLPPTMLGLPGWAYGLLGIVMPWHGARADRRVLAARQQSGR